MMPLEVMVPKLVKMPPELLVIVPLMVLLMVP